MMLVGVGFHKLAGVKVKEIVLYFVQYGWTGVYCTLLCHVV